MEPVCLCCRCWWDSSLNYTPCRPLISLLKNIVHTCTRFEIWAVEKRFVLCTSMIYHQNEINIFHNCTYLIHIYFNFISFKLNRFRIAYYMLKNFFKRNDPYLFVDNGDHCNRKTKIFKISMHVCITSETTYFYMQTQLFMCIC